MDIKNKSAWVGAIIISLMLIVAVFATNLIENQSKYNNYSFRIYRDNVELMYEGARANLVECIDSTIRIYAPTTSVNGLQLLRKCEEYDVDIFFVIAQAHIESHFGTKGMAAKTNSIFNVFAFDGRGFNEINEKGKYSHPDLSIEPYLKLLRKKYLVDGKTEIDLMHDYVNCDGNRYASSPEYEENLLNKYHQYITNEPLIDKYRKYSKYKILAGK